jgi:hypothetical protein
LQGDFPRDNDIEFYNEDSNLASLISGAVKPEDVNRFSLKRARGILEHLDYDTFAIFCCDSCNLWYSEPDQWGSRKQASPLKEGVENLNLRSLKMMGSYYGDKCTDVSCVQGVDNDTSDDLIACSYPTYFVMGINLKDAVELAEKAEIPGFIYSGKETGECKTVAIVSGEVTETISEADPEGISSLFIHLLGHPLYLRLLPMSWVEGVNLKSQIRQRKQNEKLQQYVNFEYHLLADRVT